MVKPPWTSRDKMTTPDQDDGTAAGNLPPYTLSKVPPCSRHPRSKGLRP